MKAIRYSRQYRRCGRPGCPTCSAPNPGHGPYWYAYWWEDGRVRSRYLGKEPPSPAPTPAPVGERARGALRVRTLGDFAVWRDGEQLPASWWRRRRAAALMKCLLAAPGQRLHREQIMDRIFPDAAPDTAARGLRAAIYLLRRMLDGPDAPESHLRWEGELLALAPTLSGEPELGWLDAEAFDRAAATALAGRDAAACRAALDLYAGEYLPEDQYAEWATRRREELRDRHLALLLHLAEVSQAMGDWEEAARCLRTVLSDDPCHDDAARGLMHLLGAAGRPNEALEVYRALAAALERELGARPTPEIQALRDRLRARTPTPTARRTNLPAPLTSFVGREWERAEVGRTLRAGACRLLTLTGTGGCGKTRLAIEAARDLLDDYADGVFLVRLAAPAEPDLLARTVMDALGLPARVAHDPLAALTAYLAPKKLLLVLDNCEYLVEACASLAGTVLGAAPALSILATSQVALGVLGETIWRVPSLAFPAGDEAPASDPAAYEAVQLLLERGRAARPSFTLNAGNAAAALQICRRLDGIPLAIELAAARLASLSAEALAARLDDRFALLTVGNRTAPTRQQTLRATLEWSVGLLSEAERTLLRRLSVFVGGWTLEAAEAVCAGSGLPSHAVQRHIGGLIAKSLVETDETPEGLRYRSLESVRAYAAEHLRQAGNLERIQVRHLEWCVALAVRAEERMMGTEQAAALAALEHERDNMRAALRWARERGATAQALTLATGIWRFWYLRGPFTEGRDWLESLAADAAGVGALTTLRAKALYAAGVMYLELGEYDRALTLCEESLAFSRHSGDSMGIARALTTIGNIATARGDPARGAALHGEVFALYRALDHTRGMATALYNQGCAYLAQGRYADADAAFAQSLMLARTHGFTTEVANCLMSRGRVARALGEPERAAAFLEESLALHRAAGEKAWTALSLNLLGSVAADRGDRAAARAYHEEALDLYRAIQHRMGTADALHNLAALQRDGEPAQAAALLGESLALYSNLGARQQVAKCLDLLAGLHMDGGDAARAAYFSGAATALRVALGTPLPPANLAAHECDIAAMRAALGAEDFARAWAAGQGQPLDHILDEATTMLAVSLREAATAR